MRNAAVVLAVLLAAGPLSAQCEKALKPGVDAYKAGQYAAAEAIFNRAAAEAPNCVNAWLYLATARSHQYVPGADSPENIRLAEQAVTAYKKVLDLDASSAIAAQGIGYLLLQMKHYDEGKKWYVQSETLAPDNAEIPYSIGVIDWTQSYLPRMAARAELGIKPSDPLEDVGVCNQLRGQNWDKVEDGIYQLKRATELRPDYADAMAYMNLLYRERADLQCGDAAAREADTAEADRWVDRAIAVKKKRANREQGEAPR